MSIFAAILTLVVILSESTLNLAGYGLGPNQAVVLHLTEVAGVAVLLGVSIKRYQELEIHEQELMVRRAAERLREVVWAMRQSEDICEVLAALHDELLAQGILFSHLGVNIFTENPSQCRQYSYHFDKGVTAHTHSAYSTEEGLWKIWRAGAVAYRPDLAHHDPYGERDWLREYGPVAAVIDVPFSRGTLALNSPMVNAFTPLDIEFIKTMAAVLSEGFRRLEDLDELRLRLQDRESQQQKLEDEVRERAAAERQLHQANAQLQEALEDLRRNRASLQQADKLASIGHLAAGVAHEINNPMGYITSNLRTLRAYAADLRELDQAYQGLRYAHVADVGEAVSAHINLYRCYQDRRIAHLMGDLDALVAESLEGAERVVRIVRGLRQFSHVGDEKAVYADLHEGLDIALAVVGNELKYKAEVAREYAELPKVLCYPQKLNQVFVNLLVNAAQAVEEQGIIRVRTYGEGGWIAVAISDNGRGIAPEVLPHIFDPFFTTKPVGVGTGLGLSISYGIVVEQHQGQLLVESEEGRGTTFTVKVPCINEAGLLI